MKSSTRLRLLVRGKDNGGHSNNLFVRLSPGAAQSLCQKALGESNDIDTAATVPSSSSWIMPRSSNEMHFLPLKIALQQENNNEPITIYASFNGGIISTDGAFLCCKLLLCLLLVNDRIQ